MKSEALELARRCVDPTERMNILREYLQTLALRSLHESRAFECLSFVGGTALRFLYDLPRFSEDLDFSLESPAGYEARAWMGKLKRDLQRLGFAAEVAWNDRKTVNVGWIRIAGLLAESGLSSQAEQRLSIKIEIDTRPPEGAVLETRLVRRHVLVALRHHDLPSLMAGKVHALLERPWPKGRDWYDLLWYRSKVPPVEPNPALLVAALRQGGKVLPPDWRHELLRRLDEVDMAALRKDVGTFLERREEAELLTVEHFRGLLG